MTKFSLIIPVFQTCGILKMFLNSLASTLEYRSQIIFIDDGCESTAKELLKKFKTEFSKHDILIITHNNCKGCVYSINEAFDLISGEYTVMLDSDIILNHNWQSKLINTFRTMPNAGAIGGKLIYPQSGGIQNCGLAFGECMIKHLWFLSPNVNKNNDLIKVQSTVFAFCAIPTDVIRQIGKLDDTFFNGNEDVDYQLRIGKQGYDVYINTDIVVLHWEKSNGIHRKFNQRNNLCNIWKKHADYIKPDLYDFIEECLEDVLSKNEGCILIDFCESRIDSKRICKNLQMKYSLLCIQDHSHCCNASSSIWLPELLHGEHTCSKQRYLLLCDSFIQLCENHYWYNLRKKYRNDDIIIDLNGNVIAFSELEQSFWPNRKYR